MTDVTVIILIGQEKIHLQRCIEKLAPLEPKCIWLIESQPDDVGVAIAKETAEKLGLTLKTVHNKWPGLYAKQLNWAIDNLPIETTWVLRLDADEYLTPETVERLKEELPDLPADVTGLRLELKRRFMGGEIRHGTNGIRLLRIFKHGIGRCEERAMDEHIVLSKGRCIDFDGAFYDDNLNTFEWWQEKHRGYAKREALDAISLFNNPERLKNPSATDRRKIKYYKLPRYFRAVAYFCIRYFLKLGFLDGVAGFRWHFWQGLWYRWIVDREIGRISR